MQCIDNLTDCTVNHLIHNDECSQSQRTTYEYNINVRHIRTPARIYHPGCNMFTNKRDKPTDTNTHTLHSVAYEIKANDLLDIE